MTRPEYNKTNKCKTTNREDRRKKGRYTRIDKNEREEHSREEG